MPNVSLKLVLYRKRGTDIRRLCDDYDYSMLNTVIAELWGTAPRFVTIHYEDDEHDMVRIGSDREWQECLRIYRLTANAGLPLKLHVRKATKKDRAGRPQREAHAAPSAELLLDSEDEGPLTATESTPPPPIVVPTLSLRCSAVESPKTPERLPQISLTKSQQSTASERPSQTRASPTVQATQPEQSQEPKKTCSPTACPGAENGLAALRVLSLLFNCDAIAELANPCSQAPFLGTIVHVGFTADEAHVDIDQQRLLREVIARGNFLMDRHRHDQAWELLLAALEVYPRNAILLYNAACVNALMFHQSRALQLLKEAVDAGYNDARHMLVDEDLENVRHTAEFAALYERLTGEKLPESAARRTRTAPPPPVSVSEAIDPPTTLPDGPISPASSTDELSEDFVVLSSKLRSPSELNAPAPSPASPAQPVPSTRSVPVPETPSAAAPAVATPPAPEVTVAPQSSTPQPTVTFAEPPAPPQPTASATRNLAPEVRQLMAIFPSLDSDTATSILAQCGNRVQRAVAIVLGDN